MASPSREAARQAADRLRGMGPGRVLVTSLLTEETPADAIDMMACDAEGAWVVRTPRLNVSVNGAGDAIAALFFVHALRTGSTRSALENAAASIYGLLRRTEQAGSREILTVAAQEEFVAPARRFVAEVM
jgi:pyridoxine kinase